MLKKLLAAVVVVAGLMATSAWAGKSTYCLQVVSANNISGRALKNICSSTVEATWCYNSGCRYNNSSTIRPGQEFPLESSSSAGAYVNYDACDGQNSIKSFNPVTCR